MLSAAFRSGRVPPAASPGDPAPFTPFMRPTAGLPFGAVAQSLQPPRVASSGSLCEEELHFGAGGSPGGRAGTALAAAAPRSSRGGALPMGTNSSPADSSRSLQDADEEEEEGVFEGDGWEGPGHQTSMPMDFSACSTGTTNTALHTPLVSHGHLSASLATPVACGSGLLLRSGGPSAEHSYTIGRAAFGVGRSASGLGLDEAAAAAPGYGYPPPLPSSSSFRSVGGGGTAGGRCISIPTKRGEGSGFGPSTYHVPFRNNANADGGGHADGGFVPPHELMAASYQGDPAAIHSHKQRSTAERLRRAVFETTGLLVTDSNADSFLRPNKLSGASCR